MERAAGASGGGTREGGDSAGTRTGLEGVRRNYEATSKLRRNNHFDPTGSPTGTHTVDQAMLMASDRGTVRAIGPKSYYVLQGT